MNYTKLNKIISVEELIKLIPLSLENQQAIHQHRQEIKNILESRDPRLLLIIGPCSAWPKPAVLDYAQRLISLNDQVKHQIKLVMRVYSQKPRTTLGWTGPIFQADPFATPDINQGMQYTRDMIMQVIELGLPVAAETLYSHFRDGFLDLFSWLAVGARSSENAEHRIFASALDIPIGLKNPTHGELSIAVNSVITAQHSHPFLLNGHEILTHGNPHAHLVLRGGNMMPNYSNSHLEQIKTYFEQHQVKNPALIIDVNHDNSIINGIKNYKIQPKILFNVLNNIKNKPELKKLVKGFMVESFIQNGNQPLAHPDKIDFNGLSITDPCIGWETTEKLILQLNSDLSALL